jgi:hypothetical protein
MNVARRIILASLATIMFSLSTPIPSAAWSASQQKLRSGKFQAHSACMMPPAARIVQFGFKGPRDLHQESDLWAGALEAFVETHLRAADISFVPAFAPLSSGASEDDVRQVLLQIDDRFSSISKQLDKKPREIEKSAYTLGDQVAMLPCSATSDLLVFVRGSSDIREGAVLIVTMADAKSGEILAFIRLGSFDLTDPECGFLFDDDLSNINLGSARKNAIARDRDGVYR